MERELKVGGIYRHFKGNEYLVLSTGINAEDLGLVVIYKEFEKTFCDTAYVGGKIWVRPYDDFMSKVDTNKYPDVEQEYRFEFIEMFENNKEV